MIGYLYTLWNDHRNWLLIFQYILSFRTGTESICSTQVTWSVQIWGKEIYKGVNSSTVHRGPPKFQSTNFPSPLELWIMWTISSGKEFANDRTSSRSVKMGQKGRRLSCSVVVIHEKRLVPVLLTHALWFFSAVQICSNMVH